MDKPPLLQLLVDDDDAAAQTFTYDSRRVTLGKDPANFLVLDSTYLSRNHGVFLFENGAWIYRDRNSTNGTRVLIEDRTVLLGHETGVFDLTLMGGEALAVGGSLRILVRLVDPEESLEDELLVRATYDPTKEIRVEPTGGELRLLFDTVRGVSRCTSDPEILGVITRAALEAMPAITHILFAERSDDGGWQVRWSQARDGHRPPTEGAPGFSRTMLDDASEQGISQLFATLRPTDQVPHSVISEQISSSVCVPLSGFEGPIGVIQADCRRNAATLRERELHLMTLLAEQAAVMIDRLRITQSIQRMFEGVVNASVKAIESRDPTTAGHSARVADYCLRVAQTIHNSEGGPFAAVRFGESDLRTLRYAALLHDFGKIAVPSELLLKPRKLLGPQIQQIRSRFKVAAMEIRARAAESKVSALLEDPARAREHLSTIDAEARAQTAWLHAEEAWLMGLMEPGSLAEEYAGRLKQLTRPWHTAGLRLLEPSEVESMVSCGRGTLTVEERLKVQEHASWTRCYLEEIPWSEELIQVPDFAGDHHEKLNGRGYPRGIAGTELPLQVRILTVCDIYDALTDRDRPYRTAMAPERALGIIEYEAKDGSVDPQVLDVLREVLGRAGVL